MVAVNPVFAFGRLEENGDTWLLMTRDRMIFLDANLHGPEIFN